jgi:hypothetical protein
VTKNGRFLKSAGGGVGARVRKRPFLARAKKISGNHLIFCLVLKKPVKKSLLFFYRSNSYFSTFVFPDDGFNNAKIN